MFTVLSSIAAYSLIFFHSDNRYCANTVLIENVDKAFGCIRLLWACGDLKEGPNPDEYFGSCFPGSPRVIVHDVEGPRELHLLNGKWKKL